MRNWTGNSSPVGFLLLSESRPTTPCRSDLLLLILDRQLLADRVGSDTLGQDNWGVQLALDGRKWKEVSDLGVQLKITRTLAALMAKSKLTLRWS